MIWKKSSFKILKSSVLKVLGFHSNVTWAGLLPYKTNQNDVPIKFIKIFFITHILKYTGNVINLKDVWCKISVQYKVIQPIKDFV